MYRAIDPVDAGFPGARTVIRTYREVWKTRSLGMWICARHPDRTVAEVRRDLALHPSKLFRVMTKGGLQ